MQEFIKPVWIILFFYAGCSQCMQRYPSFKNMIKGSTWLQRFLGKRSVTLFPIFRFVVSLPGFFFIRVLGVLKFHFVLIPDRWRLQWKKWRQIIRFKCYWRVSSVLEHFWRHYKLRKRKRNALRLWPFLSFLLRTFCHTIQWYTGNRGILYTQSYRQFTPYRVVKEKSHSSVWSLGWLTWTGSSYVQPSMLTVERKFGASQSDK